MMKIFILLIIVYRITSQINTNKSNISFYIKQELYNITNLDYFNCNDPLLDCSGAGTCTLEKDECLCFEGFRTVFQHPEDYFSKLPRCNYVLKKQLYALVIAMFPSFGFAHFYLGNMTVGYVQFTLFLLVGVFNIIVIVKLSLKHVKKVNQMEYRHTLSYMTFVCFLSLFCFFWYLFDIFMILFNAYKDMGNVELQSFFAQTT